MVTEQKVYSDSDLLRNILNIDRRRERAIYYRPDGTPTGLLPADAYSQVYYMRKGFTLRPPNQITPVVVETLEGGQVKCPFCPFIPQGENPALSLRSHLRAHIEKDTKEVKQ